MGLSNSYKTHYSRSFFFFAAAGHSNWGIWSAFVLQGGAQALEKLGAGDGALNIPEGFAEIIGEGAVVSAANVGIG